MTTEFNCGIDLHAHQMYVCLMDRQGRKLVHTNILHNDFNHFLKLVAPYQHDLIPPWRDCECLFGWYWLADACQNAGLTFVLAHALYLKAIHGGKNKNDRIDSAAWSLRPRDKSAKNWSPEPADRSGIGAAKLPLEGIVCGCTAVGFWTAPGRPARDPSRS